MGPANDPGARLANQICTVEGETVERLLSDTRGTPEPALQKSRTYELEESPIRPPQRGEPTDDLYLGCIEDPRDRKRSEELTVSRGRYGSDIENRRHSRSSSAFRCRFRRAAMSCST